MSASKPTLDATKFVLIISVSVLAGLSYGLLTEDMMTGLGVGIPVGLIGAFFLARQNSQK